MCGTLLEKRGKTIPKNYKGNPQNINCLNGWFLFYYHHSLIFIFFIHVHEIFFLLFFVVFFFCYILSMWPLFFSLLLVTFVFLAVVWLPRFQKGGNSPPSQKPCNLYRFISRYGSLSAYNHRVKSSTFTL